MIADAPYVRLLLAIEASLLLADYHTDAGLAPGGNMTVRHARSRKVIKSERPSISIIFVGDEAQQAEQFRNDWETVRIMQFDLQVDVEIDTEDSELDPTGLGLLSRLAAVAVRAIRREDSPVSQLVDYITPGGIDPDDENRGDDGRLVRGMTVLYRVRTDDENVLLAAGEDG